MFVQLTVGLPQWAQESTDPYIARLREESFLEGVGYVREFFQELLAAGAWKDALVKQAEREVRSPADDLEMRCLEAYAQHARATGTPMPALAEVRSATDAWEPGPEDVVLALEHAAAEELASEAQSEDAEREDDWGQEAARVDPAGWAADLDRAAAGMVGVEERTPLATVLATIAAQWERYTDKQRKLVQYLTGQTQVWETGCRVVHRRVSTLYERANHAQMQELIEEALDRWEEQQALLDEEAHPHEDVAPAVQVSLDNQARFLGWVARGADRAPQEIVEGGDKPAGKQPGAGKAGGTKPWLARPTYIHVLDHALRNGARTPREAHNRAYAADTLRLSDRIVGFSAEGFLVLLNKEKQQTGTVPLGTRGWCTPTCRLPPGRA